LASRYSLKGADELFIAQFSKLMASGDYASAAKVAYGSPGTLIRNSDTIGKLKSIPNNGGPQPIMVYFSAMLEIGTLNDVETNALVPILM
jgi:clathrin heavy chain